MGGLFRAPKADNNAIRMQQESLARQEAALAEQREAITRRDSEQSAMEAARRRAIGSRFRGRMQLLGGDERGVQADDQRRPLQDRLGA